MDLIGSSAVMLLVLQCVHVCMQIYACARVCVCGREREREREAEREIGERERMS